MTAMANAAQSTDRIEKRFEVRASRARVWRAIADVKQFAVWFGASLDGVFAEGATVQGQHSNIRFEMQVQKIQPERYFAYRWHPYPKDPKVDYSAEPTTLVEFMLEETPEGTAVTIVESGFDRVPLARRAEAFRMNEAGWRNQAQNLANYVA